MSSKQAQFNNINITLRATQKKLINNFSINIEAGTILSVMGESGSGKSTLLSFITGVVDHQVFLCEGSISCNSLTLHTLPPEKRRVGLMMQEYLLFPHMSVAENLLFALPKTKKKMSKNERHNIVVNTLEEARLDISLASKYPHTLSGGQKARVALMRTLLSEPQLLLLDEPFSRLDSNTRENIRSFVFDEVKKRQVPALLVTHDIQDVADKNFLYEVGK